MSKEIEALERLTYFSDYDKSDDDHDLVLNALTEYEAINNTNPTKALECLDSLIDTIKYYSKRSGVELHKTEARYNAIKQALIQREETSDCIYYIVETLVSNLAKPEPYDNIMGYVKTYQEAKAIIKNLENKYPKYTANNGIAYPIFRIEMMTKFDDAED